MDMRTATRRVGDVTVVDVRGRIVLGEESAKLRELVLDLLSEGHVKIVLNLAEVNYIDSSGLGTLVGSFTSVRKAGGDMKLAKLTEKVDNLMEITKLYTVFEIAENEAAAVKSFAAGAAARM
jgi:anti-sigma B factor antagonist